MSAVYASIPDYGTNKECETDPLEPNQTTGPTSGGLLPMIHDDTPTHVTG